MVLVHINWIIKSYHNTNKLNKNKTKKLKTNPFYIQTKTRKIKIICLKIPANNIRKIVINPKKCIKGN